MSSVTRFPRSFFADSTPPGRAWCIAAAVVFGLALTAIPIWYYVAHCPWPRATGTLCRAIADSPPWTLLTSLAAAPALLLTWWWRTVHKDSDIGQKQNEIDLARRGERASRFLEAVKLLGDDKLAARLGGIYLLESLAKDSEPDRHVTIETLCAFVRNRAAQPKEVRPSDEGPLVPAEEDVKAACQVLARLLLSSPTVEVDLSFTTLTGVALRSGSLAHANLKGIKLQDASLQHLDLSDACLQGANLWRATVADVNLARTDFTNACLSGADLASTHGIPILSGVAYDNKTRFPAVFSAQQHDMRFCDSSGNRVQARPQRQVFSDSSPTAEGPLGNGDAPT